MQAKATRKLSSQTKLSYNSFSQEILYLSSNEAAFLVLLEIFSLVDEKGLFELYQSNLKVKQEGKREAGTKLHSRQDHYKLFPKETLRIFRERLTKQFFGMDV